MHPLTASEILQVWERGHQLHPVDRALTLLVTANPGISWEKLARLPVGRRDDQLLSLRELTFGTRLAYYAECSSCGEKLEFDVQTSQMHSSPPNGSDMAGEISVELKGYSVRFRLPDSFDLAAAAQSPDLESARQILLQHCVLTVEREGKPVDKLPEDVELLLTEHMAQADPQADVQFDLTCPACGQEFQLTFDIESFFWAEINSLARRLLRDVHTLAQAYGWREADILSMSARRRQAYLEMVMG